MAYAYPLITLEEAQRELKQDNATEPALQRINDALEQASAEIIAYLDWELSPSDAWIEYHQLPTYDQHELWLKHPKGGSTFSITEVAEDSSRTYGATTVLTVTTDYIVDTKRGVLIRVSGDSTTTWLSGFEAIRVKLTAGYAIGDVPPEVKRVCRDYTARIYNQMVRETHGITSVSDATGTYSTGSSVPVMLTKPMKAALSGQKLHYTTCVRYEEA